MGKQQKETKYPCKKNLKFHVNRMFVPRADFNQIGKFKTIVISNVKTQLFYSGSLQNIEF